MSENTYPTISIDEVKQRLQAGETLQHVHIDRFIMNKYDISYPIQLEECTINHLDFNKSTFLEEVSLRRCEIQNLIFTEAIFQKKVNLKQTFVGHGRVQRAEFHDDFSWVTN